MKNNNFIFIHLLNDFSGSPRVLRDAICAMNCSGEKYLLTSQHEGFLDDLEINRINILYKYSEKKILKLFYYLLSQLHLSIVLSYIIIKIRVKGNSTTLVVNTLLPFAAGLVGKALSNKVIYYVHESYISPYILKSFLRAVVNVTADYVIFVSNYLMRDEGLVKPKQVVIHNGLRSDFEIDGNIDYKFKFANRQVFFAGSLREYKGVYKLIQLAINLPEFSFVGALNCEASEFTNFMKDISLPSNMTFVVRPKNIAELYASSFCVANLTLPEQCIETFGLSIIEGMSYGCPAIAPPVGGPLEIVNSNNGISVSAHEIDNICDFLRSLSSNYLLWKKYSECAKETSKKFSPTVYTENLNAFLNKNDLL
ncbi:glycosyltransferase family 4 protein [Shewanella sp. 10N.286.51.B2]|uniref:glycosyltransferase family 4 protein n=1 Tax=Shewanella sp. 10N.286.51.B2 TaxID=3229707 RepID=UPI00354B49F4